MAFRNLQCEMGTHDEDYTADKTAGRRDIPTAKQCGHTGRAEYHEEHNLDFSPNGAPSVNINRYQGKGRRIGLSQEHRPAVYVGISEWKLVIAKECLTRRLIAKTELIPVISAVTIRVAEQ